VDRFGSADVRGEAPGSACRRSPAASSTEITPAATAASTRRGRVGSGGFSLPDERIGHPFEGDQTPIKRDDRDERGIEPERVVQVEVALPDAAERP